MSQIRGVSFRKLTALLFVLMLVVLAAGCKKKTPPPPPPPAAPPAPTAPPPAKVSINSFTIEPSRVEKGQAATLRWSIANATDMSIDQGLGAVQSQGSRSVFPSQTTTYTLTASGPGGSDSRSVTAEVTVPPPPPPPAPPPSEPVLSAAEMLSRQGQDAYFDYDKSDIRADAQQALTTDGDLLKRILARDPNLVVIVEGHCDERGSAEYNLGLGDRRATAAKEYLVNLGIATDRLKTISYGKERPQCTEATEDCYQKNRRAHMAAGQ